MAIVTKEPTMTSSGQYDPSGDWRALGASLAELRRAAGHTQMTLAAHDRIHYGRSTIANVERGRQPVGRDFWESCDAALDTGQALTREYERISRMINGARVAVVQAHLRPSIASAGVVPSRQRWDGVGLVPAQLGERRSLIEDAGPAESYLVTPSGQALLGLAIPVQFHPAVLGKEVVARVPAGYVEDPFMQRPGRGLVVGQVDDLDSAAFVLDSRHARRRLRGVTSDARLLIPRAFRLDELTFALLWAVAAFDEALLADDAVIAATVQESAGYALMAKSAASRDMAIDASPASRMWLGSKFCADHIRRHLPELAEKPVFWTREQRGEEAASWLLFTHKYEYLRETSMYASPAEPLVRAFCVPSEALADSPIGERSLLLLAVALMESFGICTVVTDMPELAATPGFASDQHRRAITATWLGADGIWYVDVADNRTVMRGYRDAAGHAIHHSLSVGDTPHQRLRALADYLNLDWRWLIARCAELGEWGAAGIAEPRSRLLSLAGFDRACQFLGSGQPVAN